MPTAKPFSKVARNWIDAAVMTCCALGPIYWGASTALAPHDPANGVAVIFAPWTTSDLALVQAVDAGARFVRFGAFSFVAVVMPESAGYAARVAGAWFIADPKALFGCLDPIARVLL